MVTHLHLKNCGPSGVWQNVFLGQFCPCSHCEVGECQPLQRLGKAVSRGRVGAGDPAASLGGRQELRLGRVLPDYCSFLPAWLQWEEAAEPLTRVSREGSWGEPGGLEEELSKWPGRDSSPR